MEVLNKDHLPYRHFVHHKRHTDYPGIKASQTSAVITWDFRLDHISCHITKGWLPCCNCWGQVLIPGQSVRRLWCTKWQKGRCSLLRTSIFYFNLSVHHFSILSRDFYKKSSLALSNPIIIQEVFVNVCWFNGYNVSIRTQIQDITIKIQNIEERRKYKTREHITVLTL